MYLTASVANILTVSIISQLTRHVLAPVILLDPYTTANARTSLGCLTDLELSLLLLFPEAIGITFAITLVGGVLFARLASVPRIFAGEACFVTARADDTFLRNILVQSGQTA